MPSTPSQFSSTPLSRISIAPGYTVELLSLQSPVIKTKPLPKVSQVVVATEDPKVSPSTSV